jgi:hypothetical protein
MKLFVMIFHLLMLEEVGIWGNLADFGRNLVVKIDLDLSPEKSPN